MYGGDYALTTIELPDDTVVQSRDYHYDTSVQSVIEIVGLGKFFVHRSERTYRQNEPIPPLTKFPCLVQKLSVRNGEFEHVETDLKYWRDGEVKPNSDVVIPRIEAFLHPPDFVQIPLDDAREQRAAVVAAAAGRLSKGVRDRLAEATVFITCHYRLAGIDVPTFGTGFLINPHGYIVTNAHVAAPTTDIQGSRCPRTHVDVVLHSGTQHERKLPATVVKCETDIDLALLKIDAKGETFLCLDPGPVMETDPVIAVGYPGGPGLALAGDNPVVSLRSGQITAIRKAELSPHVEYEHSAPIENGNSGGPLVTPHGTVVGVNTRVSGPMRQSRVAISKQLVFGFLVVETAEGKGPYAGPSTEDRYCLAVARANRTWQHNDHHLIHLFNSAFGEYQQDGLRVPQSQVTQSLADVRETLHYLLQTLTNFPVEARHRLAHSRLVENLVVQEDCVEQIYRAVEAGGPQGLRGNVEAQNKAGELMNLVQAARTDICLAVNRIIGRYYTTIADASNEAAGSSPLGPIAILRQWSKGGEKALLNELGNIFMRHRGTKLVEMRFPVNKHTRTLMYEECRVSGSPAMMEELQKTMQENNWS